MNERFHECNDNANVHHTKTHCRYMPSPDSSELSVQDCIAAGQAIDVSDKTYCILRMVAGNFIGQTAERFSLMALNMSKKRVGFPAGRVSCLFLVTELQ